MKKSGSLKSALLCHCHCQYSSNFSYTVKFNHDASCRGSDNGRAVHFSNCRFFSYHFIKKRGMIRALVSARGSEQKRKKQKQSPRLKSRLPVPLYVFMTKTENRNFQGLIKWFPPNRFIQKSSQEFLFWLQTTCQNFKLSRYIGQELHRLEIWQN